MTWRVGKLGSFSDLGKEEAYYLKLDNVTFLNISNTQEPPKVGVEGKSGSGEQLGYMMPTLF